MMYVLDSTFFIDIKNYDMPLETDPAFWDWLLMLAEAKTVAIPEQVYEELTAGNDKLAAWMRAHKNAFVDQYAALAQIRRVMDEGYGLLDEVTIETLWADPWVIAHALAVGGTVVTSEKPGNQTAPRKKKIPSVCAALGVPCCTITAFLWRMHTSMPG